MNRQHRWIAVDDGCVGSLLKMYSQYCSIFLYRETLASAEVQLLNPLSLIVDFFSGFHASAEKKAKNEENEEEN